MSTDGRPEQILEERIRTLMELARVGTWEVDLRTDTRTYSPELLELMGMKQAHGSRAEFFEAVHPDDRARVHEATERAMRDGTPYRLTVRVLRPDGQWATFETQATVERDAGGQPARIRGLATDISDRARAEEEHRRAEALREQLLAADRMASVGLLAAGVAHEVSGPLSAVLGNIELALERIEDLGRAGKAVCERVEAELRDARDAAGRVLQIARDLKVFSRAEVEAIGPVDVTSVLGPTLRMAHNEIRHRARLVTDFAPVPRVLGSEARLGQVFLNLVVNAAQAIPEGHAADHEIRVATRLDPSGRVAVSVSDTGSGMPLDVLQRLFTPFFTTKPAGVGTGLGLAICQRIVASLGGELRVDSEVGRGTTFDVLLPIAPATEADAELQLPVAAVEPSGPSRRGRVLIVDDDERVGTMVGRALEDDHDVQVIGHAREALDRIVTGERFDVILSDLMMPEMTGMDLHASIAAVAPDQAERMVFLTGGTFTERAAAFLGDVPNARFDKPFHVSALRALVNARLK